MRRRAVLSAGTLPLAAVVPVTGVPPDPHVEWCDWPSDAEAPWGPAAPRAVVAALEWLVNGRAETAA